jgi:predicted aspartyl protease
VRFQFNSKSNFLVVKAAILGPLWELDALLLLDTGASRSLLNRPFLSSLGVDLSSPLAHETIVTASRVERAPVLKLGRIRALGQERTDFRVLGFDLPNEFPVQGLLGLDFLRKYRLSIDFPRGFIALR